MRFPSPMVLVLLLASFPTSAASAQDRLPSADPPPSAVTQPWDLPAGLTGKERLGRKWMDEQRIDNCKVPIDKRGTKPRPSTCPEVRAN